VFEIEPEGVDRPSNLLLPAWRRREPAAMRAARRVLGLGIRRTRLFHEWTQLELEARTGLDQTAISRLELGRYVDLRLRRLLSVISALGIDDVILVPAEPPGPRGSVDELLAAGRWAAADTRARREIEGMLSRRRIA
jgi:transcriptional regulator with XRE-family HTH domain